jgi:hypothetical protein
MKENLKQGGVEDLMLILTCKSQVYSSMVMEALENEGIPALLKSPVGCNLRGMLPISMGFFDYRLYVNKIHGERASRMVETIVPVEEVS